MKTVVFTAAANDRNGAKVYKDFYNDGTYEYIRGDVTRRPGQYDKWYKSLSSLYRSHLNCTKAI